LSKQAKHIDQLLINRLKNGDEQAFQAVFETFGENLFHFAFSYLKDTAGAEEIVQEVFLRIWEIRAEIDEERAFKSFLYRMTVNKIFNHLKHQVVRQKFESYLLNKDQSFYESPEANLHFIELEEKVSSLIKILPEQQKNIFKMSRLEGMSNPEIAETLGLSVRTVENQVYRATKFLKEHLKGEYLIGVLCLLNILG
jgi:RNA polymerase sigma-70 factor (ECF subfamily)